jgi:hypothetical protein
MDGRIKKQAMQQLCEELNVLQDTSKPNRKQTNLRKQGRPECVKSRPRDLVWRPPQ